MPYEGIEVSVIGGIDDVEELLYLLQVGRFLLFWKQVGQLVVNHDVLDGVDHP